MRCVVTCSATAYEHTHLVHVFKGEGDGTLVQGLRFEPFTVTVTFKLVEAKLHVLSVCPLVKEVAPSSVASQLPQNKQTGVPSHSFWPCQVRHVG